MIPAASSARRSIKGLAVWGDFKQLKNLRVDLIDLKMSGYSTDPDEPSVLARLAIGQAADAVDRCPRHRNRRTRIDPGAALYERLTGADR